MERNYLIDNAKGLMIIFVVLGHFMESENGWEWKISHHIMEGIYMIHMPAFIFLAGALFKREKWLLRSVQIIFLYIIFQFLYSLYFVLDHTMDIQTALTKPYWLMWFLLSLACFYIITGIFGISGIVLLSSLLIALVAGAASISSYDFSWLRTLNFLPFFIAGALYKINAPLLRRLKLPSLWSAILSLIITLYFSIDYRLWFGSYTFVDMEYSFLQGVGLRLFATLSSFCLIISLLTLLRNKQGFLSDIGARSLSVYLLHGFVVLVFAQARPTLEDFMGQRGLLAFSIVIALFVVLLITRSNAEWLIRKVLEFPVKSVPSPDRSHEHL
ncbi:acyltransferase family protein [[Erwinia] mediterraneensis]|uniref:acyltransferase family protein n=1 Tax=[Erwinia] mediterraneensis TaxID=2161819 RepID=UPI001030EE16|nr:acyltransferase family protein [[Erwinia] mediterraneensis]